VRSGERDGKSKIQRQRQIERDSRWRERQSERQERDGERQGETEADRRNERTSGERSSTCHPAVHRQLFVESVLAPEPAICDDQSTTRQRIEHSRVDTAPRKGHMVRVVDHDLRRAIDLHSTRQKISGREEMQGRKTIGDLRKTRVRHAPNDDAFPFLSDRRVLPTETDVRSSEAWRSEQGRVRTVHSNRSR
jgi:hypothetical protein